MPLTDLACRNAKPKDRPYKISDGGGLRLVITPAGSKHWRLAFRYAGKAQTLSFGSYPAVKLIEAREQREVAKRLLREGVNPSHVRRERAREASNQMSFEDIAREWHGKESAVWVPAHSQRVLSRFEQDVFPQFGKRRLDGIEAGDILAMLRKIEERGALDVAKRIRQSVGAVFRYAIASGNARSDPTADLRGALRPSPRVQHHAYLRDQQLPEFLQNLDRYDGDEVTRLAINLTLLTLLRTNEVRFGRWDEIEDIDGQAPLWRIPADRMKARREHLIPLARPSVAILRELKQRAGRSLWILPSPGRAEVISQNTMIFALYRMGYHSRLTVHGFRRTASTILNERGYNRDWIERQLAHADNDNVRSAYNAAEWLPGRRDMLTWWANYLDSSRKS